MVKGEQLKGEDYLSKSFYELVEHPDYSQEALNNILAVLRMTTTELKSLKLGESRG